VIGGAIAEESKVMGLAEARTDPQKGFMKMMELEHEAPTMPRKEYSAQATVETEGTYTPGSP